MSNPSDIVHEGDCGGTWCDFCGCCVHGEDVNDCPVQEAPEGMSCPGSGCSCSGQGWYREPTPPPPLRHRDEDSEDEPQVQLHQELSLFPETGW